MIVHFVHSKRVAEDIHSFYFSHPKKLRYVAGQFIEITIEHDDMDDRGNKRWFTLSSSPTEELLCITTKITDKCSSFKRALSKLRSGQEVTMSEAMGDFILPKDDRIPLVFIAGGIGVTPFRSMIQWLADTKSKRNIHVMYFAKDSSQIAFASTLKQPFTEVSFVTDGTKLTAQELRKRVANMHDKYLYLSGPEPMVEAVTKELRATGIDKHHLITDYFPGYTQL